MTEDPHPFSVSTNTAADRRIGVGIIGLSADGEGVQFQFSTYG